MASIKVGTNELSVSIAYPLSLGVGLAFGMSYYLNHSIMLALLHGLLNWCYIGYKSAPWVCDHIWPVFR